MDAPHNKHDPNLAHHFHSMRQQFDSGKLGMWLFLATELLLFAGLFCAYSVYRANNPEVFAYAHQFLDKNLGALNTVILLVSSFTMAWAVRNAQLGEKRLLIVNLTLTLIFACGFLSVKYVEYKGKFEHGLLWGQKYHPHQEYLEAHAAKHEGDHLIAPALMMNHTAGHGGEQTETESSAESTAAGAGDHEHEHAPVPTGENEWVKPVAAIGPSGLARLPGVKAKDGHATMEAPKNVQTFFSIYFLMTGLHGLHVLAGMAVISWLLVKAIKGQFGPGYFTPVDLGGLYWHLVDLIWIYLFPLLYLIH